MTGSSAPASGRASAIWGHCSLENAMSSRSVIPQDAAPSGSTGRNRTGFQGFCIPPAPYQRMTSCLLRLASTHGIGDHDSRTVPKMCRACRRRTANAASRRGAGGSLGERVESEGVQPVGLAHVDELQVQGGGACQHWWQPLRRLGQRYDGCTAANQHRWRGTLRYDEGDHRGT